MRWFEQEERCEMCKWYHEEDDGWCEYRAKFVDESNSCERYAERKAER